MYVLLLKFFNARNFLLGTFFFCVFDCEHKRDARSSEYDSTADTLALLRKAQFLIIIINISIKPQSQSIPNKF